MRGRVRLGRMGAHLSSDVAPRRELSPASDVLPEMELPSAPAPLPEPLHERGRLALGPLREALHEADAGGHQEQGQGQPDPVRGGGLLGGVRARLRVRGLRVRVWVRGWG